MKYTKSFSAGFVLYCVFCLLFPQAAFSQDFSSIDKDLEQLESLIADTLLNMEEQQKQLEDLKKSLDTSGNLIGSYERIIAEREKLLRDLQTRLAEMSETYRMQSALSAKYAKSSRFWKIFTLIAVPSAALLSGGIVFATTR